MNTLRAAFVGMVLIGAGCYVLPRFLEGKQDIAVPLLETVPDQVQPDLSSLHQRHLSLKSEIQELEQKLKASNQVMEQARIEIESQQKLIHDLNDIEDSFDRKQISMKQYLQMKYELAEKSLK